MKKDAAPPRLALWLQDRLSGWGDDYEAAGDFEEFYRALAAERGVRRARRACWRQIGAALPGYLKNVIIWSDAMLKHYFRVAFRNLRKYKGYSFLTIAGLAVGMAGALFILLWVQDELSYDRFHANAATLYRLDVERERPEFEGKIRQSSTPHPLAPALKADLPEIKDATRLDYLVIRRIRPLGSRAKRAEISLSSSRRNSSFSFKLSFRSCIRYFYPTFWPKSTNCRVEAFAS